MHREGLRCPKCGSSRLVIVASGQVQLKCMDCGYTWSPTMAPSGYIEVKGKLIHWTEAEAAKEKLLSELRDIMEDGGECGKVREVMAKYADLIDSNDAMRIVSSALKQAEPHLRLRGKSYLEKYIRMINDCVNEFLRERGG